MHNCLAFIKPRILRYSIRVFAPQFRHKFQRSASLTSAIGRGIRKAQQPPAPYRQRDQYESSKKSSVAGKRQERRSPPFTAPENARPTRLNNPRRHAEQGKTSTWNARAVSPTQRQGVDRQDGLNRRSDIKSSREEKSLPPDTPEESRGKEHGIRNHTLSRTSVSVPLSVPYTTSASEFLYGRHAVEAALKSGRRKLYRLYMMERLDDTKTADDQTMYKLALAANVPVKKVAEDWDKLLNKMSDRRPHNGYVLEASPLPHSPIAALTTYSKNEFGFKLCHQSSEEAAVNGTANQLPNLSQGQRYPFLLMLDRILDPGNLGAIIRTATYFGVDGIITFSHGTAPFSAATLKASAGSAEHMTLLKTQNSVQLIKTSQANGWRFFAAVAPESTSMSTATRNRPFTSPAESALNKHPCVLILGEEGSGIQSKHQKAADSVVSIERFGSAAAGIESLNVSVAAALLCDRFIRGSLRPNASDRAESSQTDTLF
ncbi:MAG: hypothetical protein Q9160_001837 [Pyrenula sp. 1 TL-2023]